MSLAKTALRATHWQQANAVASCSYVARFSTSAVAFDSPASKQQKKLTGKKQMMSSDPVGKTYPALAILKDQEMPIAKPDDEYPPWLWELLDSPKAIDLADLPRDAYKKNGKIVDFAKEKKRLAAVNLSKIKASNLIRKTR